MDLKNHNSEELWDFICSNIGFDEKGKETQDSIRLFVKLKLKEQLEDRDEEWKTAVMYNVDAETWDRIREAMHALELKKLKYKNVHLSEVIK